MARKRRQKRPVAQSKPSQGGGRPTHWMIVAAIFVFFASAFVVKMVSSPVSNNTFGFAPSRAANGPIWMDFHSVGFSGFSSIGMPKRTTANSHAR